MTRFKAALKVILSLCAVTVTICAVIATLWLYQSDLGEVQHAYPEQAEQSVEQGEEPAISPTWLYEAKLERAKEERVCSKLADYKDEITRVIRDHGTEQLNYKAKVGAFMDRRDVLLLEYDVRDCEWILEGRP